MGLENDIARFADRLTEAHGEESIAIARHCIDEFRVEDDPGALQVWSEILRTLEARK